MRDLFVYWIACVLSILTASASHPLPAAGAEPGNETVPIVVLKEHGVGMPTLAQPYLDKFVALAAQLNGWDDAKGRYFTSRSTAEAFIKSENPHYGILSLPAFLAFREKYHLDVIGQVAVTLVGGQEYHVVSKTARDLEQCKGKRLASDHIDDARFIERVVGAGHFTLADFTLVQTQRPLQTLKYIIDGEADCALIDEAQLAELSHLEGADDVRSVWQRDELPPMVVVAFPSASAEERNVFRERLSQVCDGPGKDACGEVGIVSLKLADSNEYAAVIAAYGK